MTSEITSLIGAVDRSVAAGDRDGRPTRVVRASRGYDTTAEDLWNALTDPRRIVRWFLPVTGDLRLGGRYQFEGNAGGEVTRCDPPRLLGLTWEMRGDVSWIEVRLEAEPGGGTRLSLEHTAHVPDEMWEQFGPGAVGIGWDLALNGLRLHLESGAAVAPGAAAAWVASAEGQSFMKACGAGWRDAYVRSGAEPAAAAAAAERVAAFYAGSPSAAG